MQKVDKDFKRLSAGMFFYSEFFVTFLAILFMLIPIELFPFSVVADIGRQLSVVIPSSALLIVFSKPFYDSVLETRTLRNYSAISKNEEEGNKPLIMALLEMKAKKQETRL